MPLLNLSFIYLLHSHHLLVYFIFYFLISDFLDKFSSPYLNIYVITHLFISLLFIHPLGYSIFLHVYLIFILDCFSFIELDFIHSVILLCYFLNYFDLSLYLFTVMFYLMFTFAVHIL